MPNDSGDPPRWDGQQDMTTPGNGTVPGDRTVPGDGTTPGEGQRRGKDNTEGKDSAEGRGDNSYFEFGADELRIRKYLGFNKGISNLAKRNFSQYIYK